MPDGPDDLPGSTARTAASSDPDAAPDTTRRFRPTGRRLVVCALVWLIAVLVTLGLARVTRGGPVVLPLYRSHGVHLGDLIVGLAVGLVAVAATVFVLTRPLSDGDIA